VQTGLLGLAWLLPAFNFDEDDRLHDLCNSERLYRCNGPILY
jgi:hypothetical protein